MEETGQCSGGAWCRFSRPMQGVGAAAQTEGSSTDECSNMASVRKREGRGHAPGLYTGEPVWWRLRLLSLSALTE